MPVSDRSQFVDRDRGVLTKHDRKYLMGMLENPLQGNAEYQKRFKLRQRIRNAMYDFYIISRYLSKQDINLLWDETDDWLYRSQRNRRWGDAPPYPDLPFLAECWRDIVAFFVYSQISTGIPESESLVNWVLGKGVNKGVRRHTFDAFQMYRDVDAQLDWGLGDQYKLKDYLNYVRQEMPNDPKQAERYLLNLQEKGHLQIGHVQYLYHTYVADDEEQAEDSI